MRIPFFGRKPEPFHREGQIEYLRRYNVFGATLAYWGGSPRRPLPTEPRLVPPPVPPRHGEYSQQWEDYGVAFLAAQNRLCRCRSQTQRQTR